MAFDYEKMLKDFASIAKEELGSGFVSDYYLNFAAPFASAAEYYIKDALKDFTQPKKEEPTVAAAKTSITKEMFNCPACGVGVTGRFAIELNSGDLKIQDDNSVLPITPKVIGVDVSHNCIPKVTR